MTSANAVRDLVCGMDVEAATAAARADYQGKTYYFCSSTCKEKFTLNPDPYVGRSAGPAHSGHDRSN